MTHPRLEICAANLDSAIAADLAGADRIELCSALPLDGLTPSAGLTAAVCRRVSLPVNVLIRLREGDFVYTPDEVAVMADDIGALAPLGIRGVVVGALTAEGDIDIEATQALVEEARRHRLSVTFHRAFDRCRDPFTALEALKKTGVDTILTSGQAESAIKGATLLRDLVSQTGSGPEIMAGGGVTPENAAETARFTGCRWIHASAKADTGRGYLASSPSVISALRRELDKVDVAD